MNVKIFVTFKFKIIQNLRILRRRHGSEWLQSLQRHNPGRNRTAEIFCQKWSKRYIFPTLDVARAPVVEEDDAEEVVGGLVDTDALAELGILAAPGDFYGVAGEQHVRIALTATDERIDAAVRRLTAG